MLEETYQDMTDEVLPALIEGLCKVSLTLFQDMAYGDMAV